MNLLSKREGIYLYCGNEIDYTLFLPVQKYFNAVMVIAKNREVQSKLLQLGVPSVLMPVFPKAVIMFRHAAYKFPEEKIIKIGFRHGAYHFKPFAGTKSYNMNTVFFMTSQKEVDLAKEQGIHCGVGIGFPKLDPGFDGTYDEHYLTDLKKRLNLEENKKILLFTATWDKSGISAVDRWYDKLGDLTDQYNILVTVHPWTSLKFINVIHHTKGVNFIDDKNIIPYIMISDICIGDTSSIIAECCAFEKPIITFRVPDNKRTVPEVKKIIKRISYRIDSFEELQHMIIHCLENPLEKNKNQKEANHIMFDKLDGKAGKKAAEYMIGLLPELNKE